MAASISAKAAVVALCVVAALAVGGSWEVEAASCSSYITMLNKCQNYVIGLAGSPDPLCCPQVKQLNAQTLNNPSERQNICRCFSGYLSLLNPDHVKALPGICGVNLGLPISTDPTICQRVH